MAIIENTTVRLINWPAADISHQNVCYFQSEGLRDQAFDGLQHTSGEASEAFVFISENKVRVPYLITNIQGYNYLFYRNPAWNGSQDAPGIHRIYAFIVDMIYINNKTTEITFEIDYWMTYHPFIAFSRNTFIERCHPASDSYGANLEGEPIDVGLTTAITPPADVIRDPLSDTANTNLVILHAFDSFNLRDGQMIYASPTFVAGGRGCSCLKVTRFLITTAAGQSYADAFFDHFSEEEYANFPDAVVACYIAPSDVAGYVSLGSSHNVTLPRPTTIQTTSLGSYTPHWQKTLQYPYVYAEASTGTNAQQYQFENSMASQSHDLIFDHTGTDVGSVTITGVPKFYKGKTYNIDEAITLSGYPQVAWHSSAFAQWLNENGNKMAMSGIMSAVAALGGIGATVGGVMTANPAMAFGGAAATLGAVTGIANQADNYRIASTQAPHTHGTPDANTMYLNDKFHIYYTAMAITPKHAERIDSFFDRYGYAQNKILNLRSQFFNNSGNGYGYKGSYIKTRDFSAKASSVFVPAKALNYVSTCFNRGITIWSNIDLNA